MKRIWITIGSRVEREGDKPEDKGEVLILDWDKKKIHGSFSVDSGETVDVGRSRGATGVAWHEGYVYITCRKGLLAINPDTCEEDHVVNVCGFPHGFHGMKSNGRFLKMTCHGEDVVLGIRNKKVQMMYATAPRYGIRIENTNPPHRENGLNAIGFSPSGKEYHMYGHKYLIYNWTDRKVVVEGCVRAPHDICFLNEEELLFTQSSARELWLANVETGEKRVVFSINKSHLRDAGPAFAKKGWLRGIGYDPHTEAVFVVAAPGKIYELDRNTWQERASLIFCDRREANPFDLLLDPRDWREKADG